MARDLDNVSGLSSGHLVKHKNLPSLMVYLQCHLPGTAKRAITFGLFGI